MDHTVDEQKPATPTAALEMLLRHIEQCLTSLHEQQRGLMRVRPEAARATAIRGTGLLSRQLDELRAQARQLEQMIAHQATEQGRLQALQEVGAAINSSLDLDVVLQQVMDAIISLTRAERAMLLLKNGEELEFKIARNLSQETLDDASSQEISHSIVREVAETGVPIVTINAQEDERFASQDSIVSYKLRSSCVPR